MKTKFTLKNGQLLGDGAILMISALLVNIGNYAFNLVAGRLVNPAVFGEVSLLVTMLLALSFVAMAFQLTASRFTAAHAFLMQAAWRSGLALAVVFIALGSAVQRFFQLSSSLPLVILALSIPVYFAMSVGRGSLQGKLNYRRLAGTYQVEMWVRLALGLGLIALGWGGMGVSVGLLVSLVACYVLAQSNAARQSAEETTPSERKLIGAFFATTLLYELSQILINNSDVLLVKHYFNGHDAGLYTALSMIGRVVYFGTWSVVMVLFPKVVEQKQKGLPTAHLFWGSLGIVGIISALVVLACLVLPSLIVTILFGDQYLAVSPYLWRYALATTFFALANVFVYYHLSLDRRTPVLLSVLAGMLQIGLILLWHESFTQVVNCQVVAMLVLFLSLVVYHAIVALSARSAAAQNADSTSLQYQPSAA